MKRMLNDILGLFPGDSWDYVFDTPIELEYKRSSDEQICKFMCVSVHGWYWDDDDHRTCDFYFHDAGSPSWICKEYDLTPESLNKVANIIKEYGR